MKKINILTVLFFTILSIHANSLTIFDYGYKNCVEYAESVEDIMTDGECDSDIYNMAYSYCKKHMFQGVEEEN